MLADLTVPFSQLFAKSLKWDRTPLDSILRYECSSSFLVKRQSRVLEYCPPVTGRTDASTDFYTMLHASQVICNIILCMRHTSVQIETQVCLTYMWSAVVPWVDSRCCRLALHTVWSLFTYFSVIWWPSSGIDFSPWSTCTFMAPVGTEIPWKDFVSFFFKISCVYLIFCLWGKFSLIIL